MVRFKNRYILVEFEPVGEENISQEISQSTLINTIKDTILFNYGDLGLAKVSFSLQLKYFNLTTRLAIIRVSRDYIDILSTSIFFVTQINGRKIKLRQLHCSGTIKKIEIKARLLLTNWLNSMLKKESVTKSIEQELRDIVETEFTILEKMEQ